MLVIIISNGISITANYSSEYNKTFGEFTAKTTRELLKNRKENTCYSPVSLFAALTLVAESTEGDTRQEVMNVLGVSTLQELENHYNKMVDDITALEKKEEVSMITLCNSLWIRESFLDENSEGVIKVCEDKLNCEIFEREIFEEEEMNNWVSNNTNSLIKEIVKEGEAEEIVLALINTLYYKSNWFECFSEIGKQGFMLESGEQENVEFIQCKEGTMLYKETKDFTMVNVPLEAAEMIFVLPEDRVELEKLVNEKKLNEILSLATSKVLDEGLVTITFPKFEIEDNSRSDLNGLLQDLGMETIYSENSQWSVSCKLNGCPFMVRQKTKITVDEKGIEAAAATIAAVYLENKIAELELTLDRPFMYILMKDGVPLFIGTVYNPAE